MTNSRKIKRSQMVFRCSNGLDMLGADYVRTDGSESWLGLDTVTANKTKLTILSVLASEMPEKIQADQNEDGLRMFASYSDAVKVPVSICRFSQCHLWHRSHIVVTTLHLIRLKRYCPKAELVHLRYLHFLIVIFSRSLVVPATANRQNSKARHLSLKTSLPF